MKRSKLILGLTTTLFSLSTQATPTPLLSEGFDNVATLAGAGWIFQNSSVPTPGIPWFQGNAGIFTSQAGSGNSYIASNFLAVKNGVGFVDNLLITPYFSLESNTALQFWARSDIIDSFFDVFAVLLETTLPSQLGVVTEVFTPTVAQGQWTQYTVILSGQGPGALGRFGFEYFGQADSLNYIGIDTVDIHVPEPSTTAMFGIAMLGLALSRRRETGAKI